MELTAEKAWNECLDVIRDNVSVQSYRTWFEPLRAARLEEMNEGLSLTVRLPSRFYFEWLEEHYFSLLRSTVTRVLGPTGKLFYDVTIEKEDVGTGNSGSSMHLPARRPANEPQGRALWAERASGTPQHTASLPASPEHGISNPFVIPGIRKVHVESRLNPNYTFDRFIEGDCNRLARSAALAIAQNPGGTSFNPFLLYGGVGLGKTHLIQAIGNYVQANAPADTVLYVSSEQFTNEFVQAIQHNKVSDFSLMYRQIDLLIIDDVQFFSGKEKTQEEFFHIFNALHQNGKQIVLSADRAPRDIKGVEERLLSRFQWGLSADVQSPEFETRMAILHRKASEDGIDIAEDILQYMAHNITSNIRELEGALIRLLAHGTLYNRDVDLVLAKDVLMDLVGDTRAPVTIDQIQRVVCQYFNVSEDLVRAKTRKREVVRARQVAMYFAKELTHHSLKTIGLHFGGRDHSTVIHARRSIKNQVETDSAFRQVVEEIAHAIELRTR